MPVIVTFDLPVTDKAAFEKHMTVTATPKQAGSWRWVSSTEAHWRPPRTYWKAGSKVSVDVDINGVSAGGGIYGQEDRDVDFEVGDAHIYKVNARTHQMKVFENGKLLRTLPITTGKPGFTTRSGVKVIMEKFETRRMNSETVGIPAGSSEAYDIDDVRWAMRLTNSGEFIHAAPVVGRVPGLRQRLPRVHRHEHRERRLALLHLAPRASSSTSARDRPMEPDNGYGDWNISWASYQADSALG